MKRSHILGLALLATILVAWIATGLGGRRREAETETVAAHAVTDDLAGSEAPGQPEPQAAGELERTPARAERDVSGTSVSGREAVPLAPAELATTGIEILVLDPEGRAAADATVHFLDTSTLEDAWPILVNTIRHGRRSRTDARGRTYVPRSKSDYMIAATKGGLFGWGIEEKPAGRIEIRLRADPSVHVRVVDADGQPAVGVPVRLLSRVRPERAWVHAIEDSDDEGRVRLHPARNGRALTPDATFWVSLAIEDNAPQEVELERDPWPLEPIELVLPPCGSLTLRILDAVGHRDFVQRPAWLDLREPSTVGELHPRGRPTRKLANGEVTWPFVRAEMEFVARATFVQSEALRVGVGEQRVIELVDPNALVGVKVRLVDAAGAPMAERATVLRRPGAHDQKIRSDAEGSMTWEHSYVPNRDFEAEVVIQDPVHATLSGRIQYRLTHGVQDLGDLELSPAPVVIAGIVLDEEGNPIPKADVSCGIFERGRSDANWRSDLTDLTDAEGRFAIHAEVPGNKVLVAASCPEHLALRDLSVSKGTEDLQLELRRGRTHGRIVGEISCGDIHWRGLYWVRARSSEGRWFSASWGQRHYNISGLPEGTYDVVCTFRDRGLAVRAVEIEGIELARGEEKHLDKIELQGFHKQVALRFEAPGGEPIRELFATVTDPNVPEGPGHRLGRMRDQSEDGLYRWNLPAHDLDFDVRALGFLPTRFTLAGKERTIVLQPGFEVRLVPSAAAEAVLERQELELTLQHVNTHHAYHELEWTLWEPGYGAVLRVGDSESYKVLFRKRGDASRRYALPRGIRVDASTRELQLDAPDGL